jgi:hypothetical protein
VIGQIKFRFFFVHSSSEVVALLTSLVFLHRYSPRGNETKKKAFCGGYNVATLGCILFSELAGCNAKPETFIDLTPTSADLSWITGPYIIPRPAELKFPCLFSSPSERIRPHQVRVHLSGVSAADFPLISRTPEDSLTWTSVRHFSLYGTFLYLTHVLNFFPFFS